MSFTHGVLISGRSHAFFDGPQPTREVGTSILEASLKGETESFEQLCLLAGLDYLGQDLPAKGRGWALVVGESVDKEVIERLGIQLNCNHPGCTTTVEPYRAWCKQHMPSLQ